MKRKTAGLLLISMLASSAVCAEEINATKPFTYWGLGVGHTQLTAKQENLPGVSSSAKLDSGSGNFNIFAGMQIDPYLGMELGYQTGASLVANEAGTAKEVMAVNFTSIAATIGSPFNETFGMYGKVGGVFWRYNFTGDNTSRHGFAPTFGVGMNINLYGDTVRQLRVEYNYHLLETTYLKRAGALSINAVFLMP
jgi:hypothetical protein